MKKIFVTGGTGFIGQVLIQRLLLEGWKVVALARNTEKTKEVKHEGLEWVIGDIRESSWHQYLAGCDTVVHLAGNLGSLKLSWSERLSIQLDGTENVISAAKKVKIGHFVHISTAYTEFGTEYARAKKMGQKLVEQEIKKSFPATIICPVTVYGPGDLNNLYRIFQAISRQRFIFIGNGNNPVNFIFIDDLINGLIRVINNKKRVIGQILILGDEDFYSWKEFGFLIAKKEGVKGPSIYLPKALMVFFGHIFSLLSQLGIPTPFTLDTIRSLTFNKTFDIQTSQKLLNFKPKISLEEGVEKTVNWYQQKGLL